VSELVSAAFVRSSVSDQAIAFRRLVLLLPTKKSNYLLQVCDVARTSARGAEALIGSSPQMTESDQRFER